MTRNHNTMPDNKQFSFFSSRPPRVAALTFLGPVLLLSASACLQLDNVQGQRPGQQDPNRPNNPSNSNVVDGEFVTPDPAGPGREKGSDKKKKGSDKSDDEEDAGMPGSDGPDEEPESDDAGEDEGESEPDEDSEDGDVEDKDSGGEEEDDEPKKGGNPGKLLSEADVVHIEGDLAYVLSEYSGLHILNLQDPANIQVLGAMPLRGVPFEMYLRDGELLVMVRDLQVYDAANFAWRGTSSVLRLDVRDPAKIQRLGESRVLGRISDSRMDGDRMYVVSHENGRCFECDNQPKVRVSSLFAPKGAALSKVDEVMFPQDNYYGGKPAAYFGKEQIFVALPSVRGVVEKGQIARAKVNAGNGDLEVYPTIDVDGRILSRWQMNEKDGVLRVFSQSPRWNVPPKLETFKLQDKQAPRVGALDVKLPEPEDLKSARFDGDRAYLITFRRTDPLFTFDLRDPAAPKQLGELEIPGWVYHMEPRGNRLIGAGYNVNDRNHRLSLTLFDVGNLANPKVISRVDFGGLRADFAEGQDQIHKTIKILDDKDMILVPYLARGERGDDDDFDRDEDDFEDEGDFEEDEMELVKGEDQPYRGGRDCGQRFESAIQIFDWNDAGLKVRGKAPVAGGAHRTLMHRGRLLALSDSAVAAYNIDDRDQPKLLSGRTIAVNSRRMLRMGEYTVRVSDGYTGQGRFLEVVKKDLVDRPGAVSSLSLGALDDQGCSDGRYVEVMDLFAHGENLYVQYRDRETRWRNAKVAVVSLRDPANPRVLGSTQVERSRQVPDYGLGKVSVRSRLIGAVGDRVVMAAFTREWDRMDDDYETNTVFTVLKLDPVQGLVKEVTLDRKDTHYAGGLVPAGNELGSWHARPTSVPGQLKFYYDRFFIDAAGRFQHQAINVPGVPLGRDSVHKRLLSMNFRLDREKLDPVACRKHVKYHEWDWETSECVLLNTGLVEVALPEGAKAQKLSETDISGDRHAQRMVFLHADRVFATADAPERKGTLRVVAGLDASGTLRQARFDAASVVRNLVPLNEAQVMEQAVNREVGVLDGRRIETVARRVYEPPFRWCESPQADGEQLQCAMGRFGVRRLDPKK